MAYHVGETCRIEITSSDWGGVAHTPDTASVSLTINGEDDFKPVEAAEMDYDAPSATWFYNWDTADLSPGVYWCEAWVIGSDGAKGVGVRAIRLQDPDRENAA
jgi:hypothetical protein